MTGGGGRGQICRCRRQDAGFKITAKGFDRINRMGGGRGSLEGSFWAGAEGGAGNGDSLVGGSGDVQRGYESAIWVWQH